MVLDQSLKSDLKTELRHILERHHGRDRVITGKQLARLLGYRDDRVVRQVIRELIAEGLPVASTTKPPAGYFIVSNYQEAREYADSIKNRLIENALRRRDFRRAADCYLKPAEQVRLF